MAYPRTEIKIPASMFGFSENSKHREGVRVPLTALPLIDRGNTHVTFELYPRVQRDTSKKIIPLTEEVFKLFDVNSAAWPQFYADIRLTADETNRVRKDVIASYEAFEVSLPRQTHQKMLDGEIELFDLSVSANCAAGQYRRFFIRQTEFERRTSKQLGPMRLGYDQKSSLAGCVHVVMNEAGRMGKLFNGFIIIRGNAAVFLDVDLVNQINEGWVKLHASDEFQGMMRGFGADYTDDDLKQLDGDADEIEEEDPVEPEAEAQATADEADEAKHAKPPHNPNEGRLADTGEHGTPEDTHAVASPTTSLAPLLEKVIAASDAPQA